MISMIIAVIIPCEEEEEKQQEYPPEEDEVSPDTLLQAQWEELGRFDEYDAVIEVQRDKATTRPLTTTWVVEKRSGIVKARLCLRPFGRPAKYTKDELYSPTPLGATMKALLVRAHVRGDAIVFFDVSRAFRSATTRCLWNHLQKQSFRSTWCGGFVAQHTGSRSPWSISTPTSRTWCAEESTTRRRQ